MPRTALTASVLSPTEDGGGVPADHEGTDILCEAILTGMRVWILDKAATEFTGESWYNSLLEFIQLLRQYDISNSISHCNHSPLIKIWFQTTE
jgi:hypothetical protein